MYYTNIYVVDIYIYKQRKIYSNDGRKTKAFRDFLLMSFVYITHSSVLSYQLRLNVWQ